jgi:hypothetical protein
MMNVDGSCQTCMEYMKPSIDKSRCESVVCPNSSEYIVTVEGQCERCQINYKPDNDLRKCMPP